MRLVSEGFVAGKGSDVGRDEGFDAVAHPRSDFAEGDAGGKPSRGGSVAAVVDAQRRAAALPQRPLKGSGPRSSVSASSSSTCVGN